MVILGTGNFWEGTFNSELVLCEQAEQAVILLFCIEVSENDPNEFPMPPNLRIDTKIRLVGCSEPKLQVWPCYGNLSGHNGHICHLGHCDVSKNGHKEFPIPQNLGIDTKITFPSCSEPNL